MGLTELGLFTDIIAGLGHHRDVVLIFQPPIGFFDGVDADLHLFAHLAQRGQSVPFLERAVLDQVADALGNLLVSCDFILHDRLLG